MKKTLRIVWISVAAFALFGVAVFAEAYLRSLFVEAIPVELNGVAGVTVRAETWPDFLWAGEAWTVTIECATPLSVTLKDDWTANIPAGVTRIYSNSDASNTSELGPHLLIGAPDLVVVRRQD